VSESNGPVAAESPLVATSQLYIRIARSIFMVRRH